MKFKIIALAVAAVVAPVALTVNVNAAPVYVDDSGNNVAVSGYDAVSYFEGDGVPTKGTARYKVNYDGAIWHFSTQANADKFKADPTAFSPQYGGHCAFAMSRGYLVPADPLAYRVIGKKLYLNLNKSVQATWLKDTAGFISKADVEWAKVQMDRRK